MRALRGSSCLMRTVRCLMLSLVCVAIGACSGAKPKTLAVNGKVLLDEEPLANAQVILVPLKDDPKSETPRPTGITDEQGVFHLTTYKDKDGAPEGEYAVLVQWFPMVKKGNDVEPGPNALHARFSDPQQSPLRVTVSKGNAQIGPLKVTRN